VWENEPEMWAGDVLTGSLAGQEVTTHHSGLLRASVSIRYDMRPCFALNPARGDALAANQTEIGWKLTLDRGAMTLL
jgi:hypothetical protein